MSVFTIAQWSDNLISRRYLSLSRTHFPTHRANITYVTRENICLALYSPLLPPARESTWLEYCVWKRSRASAKYKLEKFSFYMEPSSAVTFQGTIYIHSPFLPRIYIQPLFPLYDTRQSYTNMPILCPKTRYSSGESPVWSFYFVQTTPKILVHILLFKIYIISTKSKLN